MNEKNSSTMSSKKKSAVAVAGVTALALAGLGGAGLYALFTDTQETKATNFTAGEIKLAINDGDPISFADNVGNMAAGDTTYRFVQFENKGNLDIGRLETRIATDGDIMDTGKTGVTNTTQVNGDSSVGEGKTPLQIKFTACVDGKWSWTPSQTQVDDSTVETPKCDGKEVEVMPQNTDNTELINKISTDVDGVKNFAPANYFKGDTSTADVNKMGGKNVVLFDVKKQRADLEKLGGAKANPEATPEDDSVDDVAVNAAGKFAVDKTMNYMITYHLPRTAKNEYQNTKGNIRFVVTATQRDSQVHEGKPIEEK